MFDVEIANDEIAQRLDVRTRRRNSLLLPRTQRRHVAARHVMTSGARHQKMAQFVERPSQKQNVVARQQKRVHLGQLLHGRALRAFTVGLYAYDLEL